MSNKIRVRRGTDSQRTGASLLDGEIHYSTGNTTEPGRPERLWIADSSANAQHANSGDVLIGPYEFVSGDSRISVQTDYQTGRITIGYVDAATWNPSQALTAVASTYSNNSTIEVGDTFGGPHVLTVTTGSGANETKIDRARYSYNGGATQVFASPLNAVDGNVLASGSATLSLAQSVAAPAGFSIAGGIGSRRVPIVISCDPQQGSTFGVDESTQYWNFGWRVRGFASTTNYSPSLLPTAANITSTSGSNVSMFNAVMQSPTTSTVRTWTLPAGGPWFIYLVHSCSPDASGDLYGWTPTATLVGSGAVSVSEVTDIVNGDFVTGNIGGQSTTKYYRVWRIGASTGYAGGQSWSFAIA